MRTRLSTLVACTFLLVATTAHAFDLTGHWVGKWSCKGFDGSKFSSGNKNSTLAITQNGNALGANLDNGNFFYNGVPVTDTAKPEKGEVVLLNCTNANVLVADDSEMIRAAAKTKVGTFKATLKGTSIFADNFPEVGTCKYSYKRVDTTDPAVGGCPS